MSRIIDRAEMQASLRQAARAASESDRLAASNLAEIAVRIRNEMRIATLNWATVEAFNNKFEAFRDRLLAQHAWEPANFAVRAVVRDVLITLFRVTDGPGKDHELESVGRLVAAFNGKSATEIAELTGAEVRDVETGLEFICNRVPQRWGKNVPAPTCSELSDLRNEMRPIRDHLIAHAKAYSSLELGSSVPKTREFLLLAARLSDAACMTCHVPRDDLQARWNDSLASASRFWDVVARGA